MHRMVRIGLLVSLLFIVGVGAAAAQGESDGQPAIGLVDIGFVMDESLAGQEADQLLQAFVAERQQIIDEMEAELDELTSRLEAVENEDEQAALQAEIDGQLEALRQRLHQFEDEIDALVDDFREQLLSDIQLVLDIFGSENGFDLIIDAKAVLYWSNGYDVTEAVIERYDQLLLESRNNDD